MVDNIVSQKELEEHIEEILEQVIEHKQSYIIVANNGEHILLEPVEEKKE